MKNGYAAVLAAIALITGSSLTFGSVDKAPAVQAALDKIDREIKADQYDLAWADIDGDGEEDALVLMNGKSGYCGSGGCTLFVLRLTDGAFHQVGRIGVVHRPVYLEKTSHHGLRDLIVAVSGGGATPGFAVLAFDGRSYPPSPGESSGKVTASSVPLFPETNLARAGQPFDQTLEWFGISFRVVSANAGATNTVTITPSGLKSDNHPVTAEANGKVTGAEVADLNIDISPEIYVYVSTVDPDQHGSVIAYGANRKKSLSQIFLPSLSEDKKNSKGYRGHDEFAVVENTFVRRFPIYPDDPTKSEPTGKMRQLQYKLVAGEAGWILKPNKVFEF